MKIVFMGTPQAAVPTLEKIIEAGHDIVAVYTQPDRPAGRGNAITPPPVKVAALKHGLSVYQPERIKSAEATLEFTSHEADVAVVVAYGKILSAEHLTAFPLGAINVHFSLLPKYRGAAPVNWAIVHGETETGVTTMKMDIGLDTGDILLVSKTEIGPSETAIELMERLSIAGADLLVKTLAEFNEIEPLSQDSAAATYAPIMKKSDGAVHWAMAADDIVNRIRGFQPFPSSYSFFRGRRVRFTKANTSEASTEKTPGSIIGLERSSVEIACGSGTVLEVIELQPEGKKAMSASNFINGIKPQVGDMFNEQ